jgi:hypothetical protein
MFTIGWDHNQKVSSRCLLLVKITIRKYQVDAQCWLRTEGIKYAMVKNRKDIEYTIVINKNVKYTMVKIEGINQKVSSGCSLLVKITIRKYQLDAHYWSRSQSESINWMLTIGQDHNHKVPSGYSVPVKNRGYQVCNGQRQKKT